MSVVYLLHFKSPISDKHTCQHYIGWAENLEARLQHHRNGTGARLLQVAKERGIDFVVARVWEGGTKQLERQLKSQKQGPKLCPICSPK